MSAESILADLEHLWAEYTGGHLSEHGFTRNVCAIVAEKIVPRGYTQSSTERDPQGHDEAQARIKHHVQQIEIIADAFGYDPCEWLVSDDSSEPRAPSSTEMITCGHCGSKYLRYPPPCPVCCRAQPEDGAKAECNGHKGNGVCPVHGHYGTR
jgi:hypothetical protein